MCISVRESLVSVKWGAGKSMKNRNATSRNLVVLAMLLIGGEGVRLWWFSDSEAGTSIDRRAETALHFDPDLSNFESRPDLIHHDDPRQEKIVDRLLGHDRSRCGVWLEGSSPNRQVHYTWVEYESGNTRYLKDLFGHPPEVCAGKSGATPVAIHPDRTLNIGDQEIAVRHVEFADPISSEPFHIFKFAWLPEDSALQLGRDGSNALRLARLRAAAYGMPRTEARMLIAVVFGVSGPEDGWNRFDRAMTAALSIEPASDAELVATEVVD